LANVRKGMATIIIRSSL